LNGCIAKPESTAYNSYRSFALRNNLYSVLSRYDPPISGGIANGPGKLVTSRILEHLGEPFSFGDEADRVDADVQSGLAERASDARILVPGSARSRTDRRP
jgi:hypothetical protein